MNGFRSIMWGFLFMFDIRIQGVDILPNLVGYLFMYSGLVKLSSHNSEFENAKKYSIPLAMLSLFSLYKFQVPVGQIPVNPLSLGLIALSILTIVLDLLLVNHLCLGIIELAKEQSNDALQTLSHNRWKYYLSYKVIFAIFFPLSFLAPFILVIGFIPIFIYSILVLVLMMGLMKQAQNSLQYK